VPAETEGGCCTESDDGGDADGRHTDELIEEPRDGVAMDCGEPGIAGLSFF